jgi:hypothetical protein
MPGARGMPSLTRNPVSIVGAALAVCGAVLFLFLFVLEMLGYVENPYLGLLVFGAVPLAFILGLLLIPLGVLLERRRRRSGSAPSAVDWPRIDFTDQGQRHMAFAVAALTAVNVALLSMAAYGGVHYMDSSAFCGQVCHAVMEPQFVSYQDAPHSRVACFSCHVGSGAPSFLRSKANGTRQLARLITGRYERPIPSPVQSLRPARETCEQCHWPEKFHGDRPRTIREYGNDEEGTESITDLLIHVGGGSAALGIATGIHWHMNLANEIEYITTDRRRQEIPYVRFTNEAGEVREYFAPGFDAGNMPAGERRRMDCMDCHNRPAHTFTATPERAIDEAIARGVIDRRLPYVRREAVAAIRAEYATRDDAFEGIARALHEFYRAEYPNRFAIDRASIDRAVDAAREAYRRNVFPTMLLGWGTYPNELGHVDSPGCFRCHTDEHATRTGEVIRQDCAICHAFP